MVRTRSPLGRQAKIERIVLHIGIHKTGTTAIQKSLLDARRSLLARKILYPEAGRKDVGHAQLADEVGQHGASPGPSRSHLHLLEELRASGASTLMLSSEDFSSLRNTGAAEWARSLSEELQPQDIHILGYVRPQWEYIVSAYTHRVMNGEIWAPFQEFLERRLAVDGHSGHFEYPRRFGPWRDAFGGRLEVRPCAPDLLVGGDVVTDFWQAAGLGAAPRRRPDRYRNPRTGARTTEMLRALRAFLAEHHLDELLPTEQTFELARRRIETELGEDARFSPLTPELVTRVAERFAASNEEFVRDYLDGRHASLFAPPDETREQPATWSLAEASEPERRLFAEIVEWSLGQARNGGGRLPGASASLRRMRFRARLRLRG